MKITKVLFIGGALALLVVDAALAYNVGANAGREEVRSVRAEFFQSRTNSASTQNATPDQAQAAQNPSGQSNSRAQAGQSGQFPQGAANARGVNGTVKSVKGSVVELTLQNGNAVDVTIDSQTQIQKTTTGVLADLQPGTRITVLSDQTTTDNKVTARVIQLRTDQ